MKIRFLLLLPLAGCATAAQTGHFVDRGLFNNSPFVTAHGATADEARARAIAAVPEGFEPDAAFRSPVMSCGKPGEAAEFDDRTMMNSRCPSGTYRVDLALLPKTGDEREAILRTREVGLAAMEKSEESAPATADQ